MSAECPQTPCNHTTRCAGQFPPLGAAGLEAIAASLETTAAPAPGYWPRLHPPHAAAMAASVAAFKLPEAEAETRSAERKAAG